MLFPFIDSSVDNVMLQTSTSRFEFISIPKRRPIDLLFANIVSERTEVRAIRVHRSKEMKCIDVFLHFKGTFRLF